MSHTVPKDEIEAPEATRLAATKWFPDIERVTLTEEERARLKAHEDAAAPPPPSSEATLLNLFGRQFGSSIQEAPVAPSEIEELRKRNREHHSIMEQTWIRLRETMASGKLQGYLFRSADCKTEAMDPIYWTNKNQSANAHRTGKCSMFTGPTVVEARVRLKRADLELILAGKPAPAARKPRDAGAGRKPNADHDKFWIELSRAINSGDAPEDLSPLTKHMAQWSSDKMKHPYDEETIRKKVSALLWALKQPR
jgi:hypothetical protein